MVSLEFSILPRRQNKTSKIIIEEIKQNIWRNLGNGYFHRINPIGKGKVRIPIIGGTYKIIHSRFNKSTIGSPNKYWFNINQNSLDADYELLICGIETIYYLIPTSILKEMYKHPTVP